MEGNYGELEQSPFTISLVRVPYDIELAVQQALSVDMPCQQEYIQELKTAVYRGNKK